MRKDLQVSILFNRRSSTYDELDWIGDQKFLDRFRRYSNPSKKDVILDVATGTGDLLQYLSPSVKQSVGIDISLKMLKIASKKFFKKNNTVSLVLGQGEALPFPDNFFDLVTCRNGLHHFSKPRLGIKEMNRVLRLGKHIIVSETVIPDASLRHLWTFIVQIKDLGRHKDFYFTKNEFLAYLSNLGFDIIDSFTYIQRTSIQNWLEKGQVSMKRKRLITDRLLNSSKSEKKIMEIEYICDDIKLSKHVLTVKMVSKKNGSNR